MRERESERERERERESNYTVVCGFICIVYMHFLHNHTQTAFKLFCRLGFLKEFLTTSLQYKVIIGSDDQTEPVRKPDDNEF